MAHNLAWQVMQDAKAQALMRQDWNGFIKMHAPSERLTVFIKTFSTRWDMASKDYWSVLGDIWYESKIYYDRLADWRDLLECPDRGEIQYFMDDQDRRDFSRSWLKGGLQRLNTVYRGFCQPGGEDGFSWTLSEEAAWAYAHEHCHSDKMQPRVAAGLVSRNDMIAVIKGRGIVCLPENVHGITISTNKGVQYE